MRNSFAVCPDAGSEANATRPNAAAARGRLHQKIGSRIAPLPRSHVMARSLPNDNGHASWDGATTASPPPGRSMRTAINATWIVGHAGGAHTLIRDGTLVYEGNRIIHVGHRFDGPVDRTIEARDRLVAPGFIDTHVHSGHRASHRLISDTGRPM